MKDPFLDNASVISADMLEHIVGARADDAQFEQAVQYFLRFNEDDLKGFAKMRRPGFTHRFGPDLNSYGLSDRDEMINAYHEALKRI